jgi:hypothetical protein
MTDHNARQAGLTSSEIYDALVEHCDGNGISIEPEVIDDLAGFLERFIAAHSADARNGEGMAHVAPRPDYMGQTIRHGDRLTHPDGTEFTAIWLNGHEYEVDAWRAVYDDATVSRLGLQISDKGQAVLLATPAAPSRDGVTLQRFAPSNRHEDGMVPHADGDYVLFADVAAPAAPAPKDAEILQVIDERDAYHEIADDLAAQIAAITDVEIGEHSSVNDPWRNAMLAADDFIAKQLRKLLAGPSAPAPAAQADGRELDLYDEIECDLPALFGRASIEGHETGQNLAMQLQAKMRKARQQLTVTSGNAVLHISDDGEIGDSVESIVACLGDDAATIREEYPEIAANMGQAAEVLESLAQQSATPADAASEADKRDAERYRWLRAGHRGCYNTIMIYAGAALDDALDEAIRAAMSREQSGGDRG